MRWFSIFLCWFSVVSEVIQKVQHHHDLIKAHAMRQTTFIRQCATMQLIWEVTDKEIYWSCSIVYWARVLMQLCFILIISLSKMHALFQLVLLNKPSFSKASILTLVLTAPLLRSWDRKSRFNTSDKSSPKYAANKVFFEHLKSSWSVEHFVWHKLSYSNWSYKMLALKDGL